MKKYIVWTLILISVLALAGYVNKDNQEDKNGQNYFTATITEVNENDLLVEVIDSGNSGISVGGEAYISTDDCSDLAVGEYIKVVFY